MRKAVETLKKYKEGKDRFDRKIRANEEWWKLRHWQIIESEEEKKKKGMTEPVSAWLHNSINNKHADMMYNFPEPDRKSTRLNSSHPLSSRMPSSA